MYCDSKITKRFYYIHINTKLQGDCCFTFHCKVTILEDGTTMDQLREKLDKNR